MPQQPLEKIWTTFLERLRDEIPDDLYRVWLEPLRAVALSEGILYVQAPAQTRDWVRRRFGEKLSYTLASLDRSLRRVEIMGEPEPTGGVFGGKQAVSRGLKQNYRFEEFVIGAATASPTPPRSRPPSFPARPTTPSSSTAPRASARPTC